MDGSILTALAAVLGSLVGGAATVATTWVTQRSHSKRELLREDIRRMEELYGEFISECSARVIDAFECSLDKPATLLHLYALLNRIRLSASATVLGEAEATVAFIMEQYFSPNHVVDDFHAVVRTKPDPLRAFGEACRSELRKLHQAV